MRTTNFQYHLLVEYMEKYGDISKIPITPVGRERTLRHWEELSEILNSNGSIGPIRTSYQWRKVWGDFKNSIDKIARGKTAPGAKRAIKQTLANRVLALSSPKLSPGDCPVVEKVTENPNDNLDDTKNSDALYVSDSDEGEDSSDDEPLALKKDYSIQNYSDSPDNLTIISNPDEATNIKENQPNRQVQNEVQNPQDALNRHNSIQCKDIPKQNVTIPKMVAKMPANSNRAKTPTPWSAKETIHTPNPENDATFNVKEGLAKHIQDMKGDTRYSKLMEAIGKDPKQMANVNEKFNQTPILKDKYNRNESKGAKPKRKRRSVIQCVDVDEDKRDNVPPAQIRVSLNNLKPVPLEKLKSIMANNIPSTVTSKSATQHRSFSVSEINKETRNIGSVSEINKEKRTEANREQRNSHSFSVPETNKEPRNIQNVETNACPNDANNLPITNNIANKQRNNKDKENTRIPITPLNLNADMNQSDTLPNNNGSINNNTPQNVPNPLSRKRTRNAYTHEMFHYQREMELIKLEIEREKIKMKNRCLSLIENLLHAGDNK